MRKLPFYLSVAMICGLLFSCAGSEVSSSSSSSPKRKEIVDLVLAHAPTKTNYKEGERFSRSGLILEAHYDDGSIQAVHGYSLDPEGPLSANNDAVIASYDTFDVEIPISVSGSGSSSASSFPAQATIDSDKEEVYRVEAENAYYKTPLTESQRKDHSTRNQATSNLASVGEFAVNNPMEIAVDSAADCGLTLAFSLAYNAETAVDPNYNVVLNGTSLVTNIVVEKGSDPYPYYTWKEYLVSGLSLQKGRNTLTFGVKSSSSAKINIDYVDFHVCPLSDEERPGEKPSFVWGELNEDYEEEVLGSASTFIQPAGSEHPSNDIHSDLQYRYLSSGYNTIASFGSGTKEESKSRGLLLEIDEALEEGETLKIEVSEDRGFSSFETHEMDDQDFYYQNPRIDKNYYYRTASDSSKGEIKHAYSFGLAPRNLSIDGITNVRDIGGYASKLGGVIRQGLYYRGGRLNVSETDDFKLDITEEGHDELVDRIGIRTEIDLRMNDSGLFPNYRNEFGFMNDDVFPDIDYVNCPLDWTQSDMMKQSKPMIAEIFGYLANEDNYPIYLHCNIGTDRTGMITYLLGTLLGIPQEDLYRDYLYSNFGNIGGSRGVSNITGKYQVDLLSYQKDNLYFDARAYLADCGVSDEEMDSIVNLFLDFDAI